MNKLFSKIAALSVGLTLAIGVGVAVGGNTAKGANAAPGDTSVYKSVTFSASTMETSVNNYTSTWTNTTTGATGISVSLSKFNNNNKGWNYVKCGNKSSASVCNVTTLSAIDVAITKVDINITGITAASVNSITLYSSSDGSNWASVGTYDKATGTQSVAIASSAANLYYKIAFDCKKGSSNGLVTLAGIDYYYVEPTPVSTHTVTFNANGGSGSMSKVDDVSGDYTLPGNEFTAPSGQAFTGWKANNTGNLIPAGGSYTVGADVEFYAQWTTAIKVTYSAGTNGTGAFDHNNQPAGSYKLLEFSELTGVSANTGYDFVSYTVGNETKYPGETVSFSSDATITVNFDVKALETTYNFETNYSTYASEWTTTYGPKTLSGVEDVGGDYAATIYFGRANKQSSGVGSDKPYLCGNTADDFKMISFSLTEEGYKIKDVLVTFQQRGSNAPVMKLFKGDSNTGDPLDTGTIGTKNTLSASNLNDTVFTVTLNAGGTSNKGVALTSIYITVQAQSSFGTLDHISITSLPNVVYHIGETYSPNGLTVIAYDNKDESIANFKNVTNSVITDLDDPTPFIESDVPGFDCDVLYEGDGGSDIASFHVYVYALAEYELVTSEPSDWSGQYLIVGTDSTDIFAMNGALSNLDVEENYKSVSPNDNVINNGQELEWTIAKYSTGYSIQGKSGKYIGWDSSSANGLTASDTPLLNSLTFGSDSVTIQGAGGRNLTYNSDGKGRFRYYSAGTVELYKLKQSSKADEFAQTFLGAIKCDASGETEPTFNWKEEEVTRWSWKLLNDEYDTLSPAEKEQFRLGVASKTGSNIEQCLARYDYIVGKYGTTKFNNFMLRDVKPIAGAFNNFGIEAETDNSMIIIVSIAATTAVAFAALLIIKKKKHN